ncbi:hypothetical protein [Flagellimonas sp.]|uniref:hypothetical protein n=1 Tax=Flagellimonas sp. TaxID=2058762 RepID=UPI003BACAD54
MIKQNPFSLYDFLGYFVPGALLIYIILFFRFILESKCGFDLMSFFASISDLRLEQFLFFIIVSYSLGHLINFVSSITIEKYAIWKYDYPSKYLLGFEKKDYWVKGIGCLWRGLLPVLILPTTIFDLLLGDLLGFKNFYTRSLDAFLRELIKEKCLVLVNKLFKDIGGSEETQKISKYDFFRIFAHYSFEHSKNHQFKMVNYVALYGFLRVLTLISTISFWVVLYLMVFYENVEFNVLILLILGLVNYTFFMAFMKFYRRYTLEALMLIAIDVDYSK